MKNLLAASIVLLAAPVLASPRPPAAQAQRPAEASSALAPAVLIFNRPCRRLACVDQCWEVKVTYRQVISAPGETPVYETAQAVSGGAWGDMDGARCYVDQVSREGFWLNEEGLTPTSGPRKIPASAVDFLMVNERAF